MSTVNGVGGSSSINVVDPSALSQQDFVSAVYLERGNMLDTEVRRLVSEIEQSNRLLETVNTLTSKANLAQYGAPNYQQTTWSVNNNNIVLDNGYSLSVQPGDEGNSFVFTDAKGNQLIYQNQTLIPVAKGATTDVLQAGIPVMQDLTMVLDDGTEITFKPAAPDTAFDSQNLSGGLADIASIYITRGNQGISVTNLDGDNTPVISLPTVEGVTPDNSSSTPSTETKNVPAGQELEAYVAYGGSDDYDKLDTEFNNHLKNTWLASVQNLSEQEKNAVFQSVNSGLTIDWTMVDRSGSNTYTNSFTYTPLNGETFEVFFERVIDQSTASFSTYINSEEGGSLDIEAIASKMVLPAYSYDRTIPDGDKTTSNYSAQNISLNQNYFSSDDYTKVTTDQANLLKAEFDAAFTGLSTEQVAGLQTKLREDGLTLNWQLVDTDGDNDTYNESYTIKMLPGESLSNYVDRVVEHSAQEFKVHIEHHQDEGDINIESISNAITIPGFSYDEYSSTLSSGDPGDITYHSLDTGNNDGYVLLESGGVHAWEYDGQVVANMTRTNPNDSNETVSGYFARKLAFNSAATNEFASGIPVLTPAETDILANQFKINFEDASGVGNLTPEEWDALKTRLEAAKDNLTGSNQLQTVQLQRALTTYNQNFDAMSNAQSRIYTLLKDMINNIK